MKLQKFFGVIAILLVVILWACSDDNSMNTSGGGVDVGNSIASDSLQKDTVFVKDTIIQKDTVITRDSVIRRDTVVRQDTIFKRDTIIERDTVIVQKPDTSMSKDDGIEISGLVQKGPFISGSPVYIFELSDEKLLQTGRVFHGKTSDNGKFKVLNVALESKYAILEATGYFMNEVTGKESTSPITLRTIAGITDKESVNINFLTQLEYDRVVYLVLHEKKSLGDAKVQAKKEIIQTFFGKTTSNDFEELDVFGDSDDDVKLLALSILLLAENSEAKFSRTLAEISEDIETDGSYDAEAAKAAMADYAAFSFYAKDVRNVVEKLAGKTVGDFEDVIHDLWVANFGLGECSDGNEGEIRQNQNPYSAYSTTNFKCTNGAWVPYYLNPACDYGTFTDERDGQIYHTTKIGEQTWMAENLRYAGNDYKCQNDNKAYCEKYGFYYTYENIECPAGYHIPSIAEWDELFNTVSEPDLAANDLRAIGGWNINKHPGNKQDQDAFCFSAIPAGVIPYGDEGNTAYYPSADLLSRTGETTPVASRNIVITAAKDIRYSNMFFSVATPVRCVKNAQEAVED